MTKELKKRRPAVKAVALKEAARKKRHMRHKDLQALKNLIKDCRANLPSIADEATFLDLC